MRMSQISLSTRNRSEETELPVAIVDLVIWLGKGGIPLTSASIMGRISRLRVGSLLLTDARCSLSRMDILTNGS